MDSVLVCSTAQAISLKVSVENDFLSNVLVSIGNPSFLCIIGSRLLINLKEAVESSLDEGTNYRSSLRSVSDIIFAEEDAEGLHVHLRFLCMRKIILIVSLLFAGLGSLV